MTFNSAAFFGFLTPVIILYYALPARLRALWVFLASAAFYAFYSWKVLPFLIIYGLAVHGLALFLEPRGRDRSGDRNSEILDPNRSASKSGGGQDGPSRTGETAAGGLHKNLCLAFSVVLLLMPLAIC